MKKQKTAGTCRKIVENAVEPSRGLNVWFVVE